jgi:hypothetical protein
MLRHSQSLTTQSTQIYIWVGILHVVIDWEWRKIPTLIYSWVDSVVIDWEWRKITTLIYFWVDSVVIDWEWRKIPTLNIRVGILRHSQSITTLSTQLYKGWYFMPLPIYNDTVHPEI